MWINYAKLNQRFIYRSLRFQSNQALRFSKSTLGALDDFSLTKITNVQMSDYNNLPLQLAITKPAADKLNKISVQDNNDKLALRLKVSSGGCHGFQYDLELTTLDSYTPEDGDTLFEREGAKLIADKEALEILRDSKVDYVTELIGESFKVVESPLAKSSCGCGSSFDVDFDELQKNPSENN